MKKWTWETKAIWAMAALIVAGWIPHFVNLQHERRLSRAEVMLPTTADFFAVSYVELERGDDGHLVVFTDAHVVKAFEGRFRVTMRDRDTSRHVWTPEWSSWIQYVEHPDGVRYRQPETLQWWANIDQFVEPPPGNWIMETCWQARYDDPTLGLVELKPLCVTSTLSRPLPQQIIILPPAAVLQGDIEGVPE